MSQSNRSSVATRQDTGMPAESASQIGGDGCGVRAGLVCLVPQGLVPGRRGRVDVPGTTPMSTRTTRIAGVFLVHISGFRPEKPLRTDTDRGVGDESTDGDSASVVALEG